MAFSSWRGVVGMINPTMRPGVTEEVIRLLPEGIGLIPLFLNIRRGTADEFETMKPSSISPACKRWAFSVLAELDGRTVTGASTGRRCKTSLSASPWL